MAIVLSDDEARRLRLRAQRLDVPRGDVADAGDPANAPHRVRIVALATCGIQAQYMASAALAVRARAVGVVTAADVERARVEERTVIRTWLMRGTLHLVNTEDLRRFLPLLGTRMIAGDQRRRTQLGLNDAICARALPLIREALAARGPLTRAELADALAPHGIPTAGQAMPHLLYYAAFQALICFGPDRDGEPAYVLLDEWLGRKFVATSPPDVSAEQQLVSFVARYLRAYGPARLEDFASWTGLPLNLARAAWSLLTPGLTEVEIAGQRAWDVRSQARSPHDLGRDSHHAPVVNLIPAYDPYLLGYQNRDLVVAPEHARHVHPGGGVFHNVLLVDGRALGTWRTARRRDHLEVSIEPFAPLTPDVYAGIEAEVTDLARFYETRAELTVHPVET